ncbi:MAG: DNA-3-methyladenine glycosylase 2 family protein [Chloroflexi bacterium]|nr:MAG: DNA-3-methyladenine glycosylase 2 family protein [Chloroflexota bacterium]
MASLHRPLDEASLQDAVAALVAADHHLAGIVTRYGPPPLWAREPGFPTLIHIILEQQVSLASARAAFDRLLAAVSPLTPARFLTLDDATLRAIGFSRQKAGYARHLAQTLLAGQLDLDQLAQQDDAAVRSALLALKGIGPWSADIYLLMALRRPDVWPVGDLALQVAMQRVKQLPSRPTADEMEELAEPWRPWRAAAARLLWHHYLSDRL